ncbi:hypothetical protein Bca101_070349 [Brassica carinata]
MGATSLERHHQVALITLLERPNQSDREKSLAVSSLGDARTSPERHLEVAPAESDVMGATGRSRSRFHHPETREGTRSDLSQRHSEVAPEA